MPGVTLGRKQARSLAPGLFIVGTFAGSTGFYRLGSTLASRTLKCGILFHNVARTVVATIRVQDFTLHGQVAQRAQALKYSAWELRGAGVLPKSLGSNLTGAASAARICRETFDQNDHSCLPRILTGRGKVTWLFPRERTFTTRAAGRSDKRKPLRATATAAPR